MRVLITRSGGDAENLARQLGDRGFESLLEPLLQIQNLETASLDFFDVQAIVVTSSNGIRALAEATGRRDLRVLAVGDSSARAAREAGFTEVDSADGDVAALGKLIEERLDPKAGSLFHAAGADMAGDLARSLETAGFTYRRQVLYQAVASRSLSPAAMAAIKDGTVEAALFYSPRTAEAFVRLARKARIIKGCRRMTAYCLSPNVAAAARKIPWSDIRVASRPTEAQLLALLDRMTASKPQSPAAGEEQSGAIPPNDPPNNQPNNQPRRRRGVAVFLATIILIALVIGGGLALRGDGPAGLAKTWRALFDDQGPAQERARERDLERARLTELSGRVEKLESNQDLPGLPELQKLEAERGRLQAQLDATLKKLAVLEQSLAQVKKTLVGISALPDTQPDTEARQTLRQLSSRLGQLEDAVSVPDTETDAKLQKFEAQIAELEKKFTPEADAEGHQSRNFLLALGQLREAIRGAGPYGDELASLIAVAGKEPEIASLTASLSDRRTTGIPTRGMLGESFQKLAGDIVVAESKGEAKTWFQSTVARIREQVRWRRTDGQDGTRAEAVVARVEGMLAAGNLPGAIKELEALSGAPAKKAKTWLADARAQVSAEKILRALQNRAVARNAALDK